MNLNQNRRSGLTLTELLVVVAIVVIVTSVLAPLLTNSMQGREVREGVRQVNVFFQAARTKAKQSGRPVGVMLRRSPTNPNMAYQLAFAEEVPPFTGLDQYSKALVRSVDDSNTGKSINRAYIGQVNKGFSGVAGGGKRFNSVVPLSMMPTIQPNDEIRFNNRGPRYRITNLGSDNLGNFLQFEIDGVDTTRHTISALHPVTFEVYQRPRQTTGTPIELPTGTALVMDLSGVGLVGNLEEPSIERPNRPRQRYIGLTEFRGIDGLDLPPLTIMFSPDGSVDRIYRFLPPITQHMANFNRFPPKRPQSKIYLFLGKDGVDRMTNLLDGTNLWITIDPESGAVVSAANAVTLPEMEETDVAKLTEVQKDKAILGAITSSRQLAATGQSIGGR